MKRLSVLGRFLATADEHDMLPRGARVLVAVSGGADSTCLLALLRKAAPRRRLELRGFHMNHRLRPEARDDERFVRRLFDEAGIELAVVRSDVAGYARRHRVGLEQAGRELRYRNAARCARRNGCTRVAFGHTADDNLETMLLNLARGTGPRGLAGIPPRREAIVRPLIDLERCDVLRYLQAAGLDWVTDNSNSDTRFRRNLVRHEAASALRETNPAAAVNARRAARLLRDEDRYLDSLAAELVRRAVSGAGRGRHRAMLIDTEILDTYNGVLKRRALRQLVPSLDAEGVERVLVFITAGSGRLELGKGLQLRKRRNLVELTVV